MNICQKIQCPYFSDNHRRSYGCQRYPYSKVCHLADGKPHADLTWSEYYLAVPDGSLSEAELLQWQKENNRFFLEDPKYTDEVKFFNENSDWADGGFVPGEIKSHLRSDAANDSTSVSNTF